MLPLHELCLLVGGWGKEDGGRAIRHGPRHFCFGRWTDRRKTLSLCPRGITASLSSALVDEVNAVKVW